MADWKEFEIEDAVPGQGNKKKIPVKALLISAGCVLVAAVVVAVVLLTSKPENVTRIVDFGTVLKGVSVGDVDISGMSRDQAIAATAGLEGSILNQIKFTLDVNGEMHEYAAEDFNVISDYQEVITKALSYGHTGTFEERKQAADKANSEGVQFAVTPSVDKEKLKVSLVTLKQTLDKAPQDATYAFMPWGYHTNGTAYQPDLQELIKSAASGKPIVYPEDLARVPAEQMPNKFRYQFWQNDEYKPDYIPAAANISRFQYVPEVNGLVVDVDPISDQIVAQVQNSDYSTITVPAQPIEAAVKLADIQKQTQLIASWTSSYSTHYGYDRNWNVAKLSGIICGVKIDPGVEWSINEQAGPRSVALGWRKASGIVDGGYVDQPGGGVCQISSTTYNTAIRAGLGTKSQHHSIVSGYMPKGLDATISTGGPDLKLTNPYTVPVFIVSYMDPEDKGVTVEIYGPPLIDPATGEEVIYNFSSVNKGAYGTPTMAIIYNSVTLPDGTPILPGASVVYAEARPGQRAQTYKHFLKLDGTEYNKIEFENVNIHPINGKTYVNGPDPALATPPPVPTEEPAPTPTV